MCTLSPLTNVTIIVYDLLTVLLSILRLMKTKVQACGHTTSLRSCDLLAKYVCLRTLTVQAHVQYPSFACCNFSTCTGRRLQGREHLL